MINSVKTRYPNDNLDKEICVYIKDKSRLPVIFTDDVENGYGVFLSKENRAVLKFNGGEMTLNRYEGVVLRLSVIDEYTLPDGISAMILTGMLAERYIREDICGQVLSFSASDDIFTVLKTLEKDEEHSIPSKNVAKLAFSVLMDLYTYKEKPDALPRLVSDAIDIIEAEYAYLEGVDDLADRVGVTKSHLIRVFHASMQVTPGRYLEAYRITQAKAFLASGEVSIEAVSGLCGFACRNYFSKVFKRVTGTTPKAYIISHQTAKQKSDYILPDDIYV